LGIAGDSEGGSVSQLDPKVKELAHSLADAVADGRATREQILSAMQLAWEGGEIAGSLRTCNETLSKLDKATEPR
jgi:hypothetical protein